MKTAEQLNHCLWQARNQGWTVRFEYLSGQGGGACEYQGKRWLFVDLALPVEEQLESAMQALQTFAESEPTPRRAAA